MADQEFILFYNGPLSQWYNSPFIATTLFPMKISPEEKNLDLLLLNAQHNFANCEQYMMFEKAMLFQDYISASGILKQSNPKIVKQMGRNILGFSEKIWETYRELIVFTGNYHKFTQNEDLSSYLKTSGQKIFVEASPYDKIWGIGMDANHPDARNPTKWKGLNLLGKAITTVRNKLFPSK